MKANQGKIPFGSAGAGSTTHVAAVLVLKAAGLEMVHVPYRGVAPAFTDLLAGHIQMLAASPVELKPYLESGKVKVLAVVDTKPSPFLPGVPLVTETLKDCPPAVTYNGLLGPKGISSGGRGYAVAGAGRCGKRSGVQAAISNVGPAAAADDVRMSSRRSSPRMPRCGITIMPTLGLKKDRYLSRKNAHACNGREFRGRFFVWHGICMISGTSTPGTIMKGATDVKLRGAVPYSNRAGARQAEAITQAETLPTPVVATYNGFFVPKEHRAGGCRCDCQRGRRSRKNESVFRQADPGRP